MLSEAIEIGGDVDGLNAEISTNAFGASPKIVVGVYFVVIIIVLFLLIAHRRVNNRVIQATVLMQWRHQCSRDWRATFSPHQTNNMWS